MTEYITKEQAIEWFRPYGHTNEGVPYYGLVTDIREMKAADVAPVAHGRWIGAPLCGNDNCRCSECGSWHNIHANSRGEITQKYCPNCGAKMDGGAGNG